jgi:hypothetical protein
VNPSLKAAAIAALLLTAAPAQAESMSQCIQRENLQAATARMERRNAILRARNELSSKLLQIGIDAGYGKGFKQGQYDKALAEAIGESQIAKMEREADSADMLALYKPSACY